MQMSAAEILFIGGRILCFFTVHCLPDVSTSAIGLISFFQEHLSLVGL
jgi:hypothetical protein